MKRFSLIVLGLLLILSACQGDLVISEKEKSEEIPELTLSEEEEQEGWRYYPALGMKVQIPRAWTEKGAPLISYMERKNGVKMVTWSFVPLEKMDVYRELNPEMDELHDPELIQKVKDGFLPFLRPIMQYGVVAKAEEGRAPADTNPFGADHAIELYSDEKNHYMCYLWEAYKTDGMKAASLEGYERSREEAKEVAKTIVTGRVITDDEVLLGLSPISFTSPSLDGMGMTEAVFQQHPYTILAFWSGTGKGCTRDWETFSQLEDWLEEENLGLVGVILPSHKMSFKDMDTSVAKKFPQVYADDSWRDYIDFIEYMPKYLLVDDEGNILEVIANKSGEKAWQRWWRDRKETLAIP